MTASSPPAEHSIRPAGRRDLDAIAALLDAEIRGGVEFPREENDASGVEARRESHVNFRVTTLERRPV